MSARLWLTLSFALGCSAAGGDDPGNAVPNQPETSVDSTAVDALDDVAPDTTIDTAPDTAPEDTRPVEDSAPPLEAGDGGFVPGCGLDSDGDGITDAIEGKGATGGDTDTDKDGVPDWQDLDSDGDGIPDVVEWVKAGCELPTAEINDADGDGIPNFQDLDSDGNGLPDKDEACPPADMLAKLMYPTCSILKPYDFDSDGRPDYLDFDNDHDSSKTDKTLGLADSIELSDAAGKYVGLVDTDGDGIPDVYDIDSDNDFILDLDDGTSDPDGDKKQSFRDTDSDEDGVPDICEARGIAAAGPGDYSKPLADSDGDGAPDYLDRDSDGDLLADGFEDPNGNCTIQDTETDRKKADSDGDGVSDLIEVSLIGPAGARDATKTPEKAGKFYFVAPYSADGSAKPTPTTAPLALKTDLKKGDIGFVVDTSYSMEPEFNNLKYNLGTIIDTLKAKVIDVAVGVAAHDDYPTARHNGTCTASFPFCPAGFACDAPPVGVGPCMPITYNFGICDNSLYTGGLPATDDPYYQLTAITTDKATATTAITGLRMANGGDLPEDQVSALHYAFTGKALSWGIHNGCPGGARAAVADTATHFGALRFRKDALPILVSLSDAAFHNGIARSNIGGCIYGPGATTCSTGTYTPTTNYTFPAPTIAELATELKAKGARFVGAAADDARAVTADTTTLVSGPAAGPKTGVTSAARSKTWAFGAFGDMEYLVDQTTSYVNPEDFTHGPTCPAGQCCTGFAGAGIAPDAPGGKCKLVINVNHNGDGLSTQITEAVIALIKAVRFDVHVEAIAFPGPVDAVDTFIERIEPSLAGGTDPTTGDKCVTIAASALADRYKTPKGLAGAGDIAETVLQITPGQKYCYTVVPKPNTTVKPTTSPQLFTATLRVLAEHATGSLTLGTDRDVLFIVPPVLN